MSKFVLCDCCVKKSKEYINGDEKEKQLFLYNNKKATPMNRPWMCFDCNVNYVVFG